MFSQFKQFDEFIEPFAANVKRLKPSFILHDVKEEEKVPAIISCTGSKFYNLLCDLVLPKFLESYKCTEIANLLLKHWSLFPE